MTASADPPAAVASSEEHAAPRSDLKDAAGWTVLGLATVIASVRMDRLESQNINPLTVPGLLPGLLGLAMVLLGLVLGVRSWRRGALVLPVPATSADGREQNKRVGIAILMCIGYGVVLVGHGIPFWLASSVYVSASILIFRRLSRDPQESRLDARAWFKSLLIGTLSSVVTWAVFEQVFLVRLP